MVAREPIGPGGHRADRLTRARSNARFFGPLHDEPQQPPAAPACVNPRHPRTRGRPAAAVQWAMPVLPLRPVDLVYFAAAIASAPIWLPRMIRTGKIRTDWAGRFGGQGKGRSPQPATEFSAPQTAPPTIRDDGRTSSGPGHSARADAISNECPTGHASPSHASPPPHQPHLLFHAVSVGEVNAIRGLVDDLARDHRITVATTTDTGFARAVAVFGERHRVVRYPLDFTFAVERFLDRVQPDAVALVELEVWPNFVRACVRRGIPVVVINGRLSAGSFRGYRRFRRFVAPSFARLHRVLAQDEAIAERFRVLGVPPDRVEVAGTMKWDNAVIADAVPGSEALRASLGIDPQRPLVVGGSTGPGEEALLRASVPAGCQLLIAPRKPERFDEAETALAPCRRRSATTGDGGREGHGAGSAAGPAARPAPTATIDRFLLDTIGELRAAYALADVVVVGRTFTPLRGSDMIEPVGLGKPVIVGPSTDNFESVTRALVEGGGMLQVTREELPQTIARLLADPDERQMLVERGRAVIRAHQGVVARHAARLRAITGAAAMSGGGHAGVGGGGVASQGGANPASCRDRLRDVESPVTEMSTGSRGAD